MMSLKAPVFFAGRVVLTRLAIKPISVPPGPGGIVAGVPWLLSPGLFSLCSGEKRRLAQRNQRETQGAKVIQPGSGGELVEIPTPRNRSAAKQQGDETGPPSKRRSLRRSSTCFGAASRSRPKAFHPTQPTSHRHRPAREPRIQESIPAEREWARTSALFLLPDLPQQLLEAQKWGSPKPNPSGSTW